MEGGGNRQTGDAMRNLGFCALQYVTTRRAALEICAATAYRYRITLLGFAEAAGVDLPIGRVARRHIDAWFAARGARGVAASTLSHEYAIVRGFCGWCVELGYLAHSPCDGVKGPRRPSSTPRAMEGTAVGLVLDACPDARARLIVLLMVQQGLRCCEVARLETGTIDLADQMMLAHGKGGRDRWLPIPEESMTALRDYLAEYPLVAGPLIRAYRPPYLGMTPGHIGYIVRLTMMSAEVKLGARDGRSAHALRHTFASDLVEAGVDIEDVRQALGHESLQSTSIYTKRRGASLRLRTVMEGRTYRPSG